MDIDVEEISLAEERAALERGCQKHLGISADEFQTRWQAGAYRHDSRSVVTDLAMSLREDW